jgi:hypothetical protein
VSDPVVLQVRNTAPGFAWVLYEFAVASCFPVYDGPPVTSYGALSDVSCSAATLGAAVCTSRRDGSPSECRNCETSLFVCVREPPTFVAAGDDGGGSGRVQLPPAVDVGDLLIAAVAFEDEATPPPPPPGWDVVATERIDRSSVGIYARVTTEAAPRVDFEYGNQGGTLVVGAWRGVAGVADVAVNRRGGAPPVAPSLQTDGTGLLVMVGAVDFCSGLGESFSAAPPMVLRAQVATDSCNDTAVFVADEPLADAGPTGTRAASFSTDVDGSVGALLWLR